MSFFQPKKKWETLPVGRGKLLQPPMRRRYGQDVKSLLRKKPVAGCGARSQLCASCILTLTAMPRIYLLGILLLLASGCKKDDTDPNGLPAATQEGKNTAGFLLNGQPWLPAKNPSLPANSPVGALYGPLTQRVLRLSVSLYRYQDAHNRQGLNLYVSRIRQPGTYQFNQTIDPGVISGPRPHYGYYSVISPSPGQSFYTASDARGQVLITRFDTVARVVAGTFEAKLKEDGGPDSLSITQGRFDIKF